MTVPVDDSLFPSFLIIGAHKSGTTSLHQYLRQHPEISLPVCKETNFFALDRSDPDALSYENIVLSNRIDNLDDYLASFEEKPGAVVRGEVCPLYLVAPNAAENIKRYCPDCRLMVILRNPIDRAFSSYYFYKRPNEREETFEEFIHSSMKETSPDHHLLRGYSEDLERFDRCFSPRQLQVYLFEDLCDSPGRLLEQMIAYIGVKPYPFDTRGRFNRSGEVRSRFLLRLVNRSIAVKTIVRRILPSHSYRTLRNLYETKMFTAPPAMSYQIRSVLMDHYREDIIRLQSLIQKDLTHWLEEPAVKIEKDPGSK